jgi:apolipoprotein D and lipocalin family protein
VRTLFTAMISIIISGCMGVPRLVTPVQEFDLENYLGTWYEIARLDHSFERGLSQVTAVYSMRDDGGITVRNRGYSAAEDEWREAEGKAYFVGSENEGHLKVSFFGPFYSSYVIFELDRENYRYAFVSGYNTSYLWLLSRTPTIDETIKTEFIRSAQAGGFDTDKLIFVEQDETITGGHASLSSSRKQ